MDFSVNRSFVFDSLAMMVPNIERAVANEHGIFGHPLLWVVMAILYVWMLRSEHRIFWTKPNEQEKILQLILIPSIHGIASFVALQANENSKTLFLVVDSIKECSIGLGIGIYLSFLHTYLSNTLTPSVKKNLRTIEKRVVVNVFPVTLVQPQCFVLNTKSLKFQKFWTWQFFVIRLVCSVLMIILQLLDIYPIWLSWALYLMLNVSVCLALYTVSAFYQAFKKDFTSWRLTAQIFCIKGIVFVCFCQGGLLRVLVAMGINSDNYWRQERQHNLVILEMMLFSFIQWLGYNAAPYYPHVPQLSKTAAPDLPKPSATSASPKIDEPQLTIRRRYKKIMVPYIWAILLLSVDLRSDEPRGPLADLYNPEIRQRNIYCCS